MYLKTPNKPFYNVSLTLESDGIGQRWELTRYGMNAVDLENIKIDLNKKLS
jgi:hypothetical protein